MYIFTSEYSNELVKLVTKGSRKKSSSTSGPTTKRGVGVGLKAAGHSGKKLF